MQQIIASRNILFRSADRRQPTTGRIRIKLTCSTAVHWQRPLRRID